MNGNNPNRTAGQKLKADAQKPEAGGRGANAEKLKVEMLKGQRDFGESPKPTRETRVLPVEGLLTRRDFAARCQVDVRTVERWQAEGVVPFIKVRDVVRFHWPTTIAHLLAHFTVLHDGEEQGAKAETLKR
jgi:hypothetical protein